MTQKFTRNRKLSERLLLVWCCYFWKLKSDELSWGNVNPIGVRACYDEGKRVAETLTYGFHHQDGVDVRVARIFNTYGEDSPPFRSDTSIEPLFIS